MMKFLKEIVLIATYKALPSLIILMCISGAVLFSLGAFYSFYLAHLDEYLLAYLLYGVAILTLGWLFRFPPVLWSLQRELEKRSMHRLQHLQ